MTMRGLALTALLVALAAAALPAVAQARRPSPLSEAKATAVAERHAQEEPEGEFHWEVTKHESICFRGGRYWFKCLMYSTLNAGEDDVTVKATLLVVKDRAGRVVTDLWLSWVTVGQPYPAETASE
jgi:hypothetical protein